MLTIIEGKPKLVSVTNPNYGNLPADAEELHIADEERLNADLPSEPLSGQLYTKKCELREICGEISDTNRYSYSGDKREKEELEFIES